MLLLLQAQEEEKWKAEMTVRYRWSRGGTGSGAVRASNSAEQPGVAARRRRGGRRGEARQRGAAKAGERMRVE